jgi:S1-like/BURAN domain/DBC1
MSFQKNPPWQKSIQNVSQMPNFQQQMSLQQLNQIGFLQNQLGFQNAQPMLQMVNQVPTVQYPATRVNPMAFQQQPSPQQSNNQGMQQQQQQQQQSKYNTNQKVFSGTGVVSKIQNDIGFIDDEVLFHKNVCVKGLAPKLGDHVLVEAAYNQNMPFKWNATRVQVLPRANNNSSGGGGSGMQQSSKSYSSVPPPRESSSSDAYRNARRYSPERRKSPERRPRSRDRREIDVSQFQPPTSVNTSLSNFQEENERKRRREERDRERSHRPRESLERRERSPIRKPSPKRRRVRPVPRYNVEIPKISLTIPIADIVEIKKRYQKLYVPSDFFTSGVKWVEAFPANAPFSINKTCSFHVLNKEVAPLDPIDAVLDPPDADYLYSAKVMLMTTPAITDIYKKCFARAEDMDSEKLDDSERDFIHPTRLISFLVGLRGKNETMAIGGAWSKKLDGELEEKRR